MTTDTTTCAVCGEEATFTGSGSTLMGVHRFQDAAGQHVHDPNQHCGEYACANGHRTAVPYKEPCPVCDYNRAAEPTDADRIEALRTLLREALKAIHLEGHSPPYDRNCESCDLCARIAAELREGP